MSATLSVIIATAQSVAKVFVIGMVGFFAVKFPKAAPILPSKAVGLVARFSFNLLVIPLIFSTTAVSVTPQTVGDYWFVLVAAFFVLAVSYITATVLRLCIPIKDAQDFCALRIAATFPNIVALPILIFPSLCEYSVVNEGYFVTTDDEEGSKVSPQEQCMAMSNTMIFCYFFSWSLAFWSFGHPQLMAAAKAQSEAQKKAKKEREEQQQRENAQNNNPGNTQGEQTDPNIAPNRDVENNAPDIRCDDSTMASRSSRGSRSSTAISSFGHFATERMPVLVTLWNALKQTFSSPPFLAMLAGLIVGCIPPLRSALFDSGGAVRFLGSAMESLAIASPSVSTIVVAGSLVPEERNRGLPRNLRRRRRRRPRSNPIMSDPNFGPNSVRLRRHNRGHSSALGQTFRNSSVRFLNAVPRSTPEMRRLMLWFVISRLIVAPGIVVGTIVGLDCKSWLPPSVPNLAKLVVIVNACVPGALIVVVVLKSKRHLACTAAAVAKVYLPSYILSIFTIAGWTVLGLFVTLPDENGKTICQR